MHGNAAYNSVPSDGSFPQGSNAVTGDASRIPGDRPYSAALKLRKSLGSVVRRCVICADVFPLPILYDHLDITAAAVASYPRQGRFYPSQPASVRPKEERHMLNRPNAHVIEDQFRAEKGDSC